MTAKNKPDLFAEPEPDQGSLFSRVPKSPAQIRADALRQIDEAPERIPVEYKQWFGNVLNAGNAAELFPDYARSLDSPTRFRAAVHPAAQ